MKKIIILSLLIFTVTFLAFSETENNLQRDILFADITTVQAESSQPASSSNSPTILGVGYDILFGTDNSKQKTEDSQSVFVISPEYNFYETPFITTVHFLVGTRVFNSLDLYGRFGLNYGFITKETQSGTFASLSLGGIAFDANVKYNLFFTSSFGLYIHTGFGVNYSILKFIDLRANDSSLFTYSTRYEQAGNNVNVQFYANAGLGFTFRIAKKEGFNIGYNTRYYFSSIYNTDEYILKHSNNLNTIIQYGNNQLVHGINIEYLYFM